MKLALRDLRIDVLMGQTRRFLKCRKNAFFLRRPCGLSPVYGFGLLMSIQRCTVFDA